MHSYNLGLSDWIMASAIIDYIPGMGWKIRLLTDVKGMGYGDYNHHLLDAYFDELTAFYSFSCHHKTEEGYCYGFVVVRKGDSAAIIRLTEEFSPGFTGYKMVHDFSDGFSYGELCASIRSNPEFSFRVEVYDKDGNHSRG